MIALREGHRIGERIQQEQQLSAESIQWIVCIAQAILRAFAAQPSPTMTEIAKTAGVSRQTLYQHLRLAIEALYWVYQSKQRLSGLLSQLHRHRRQWLAAQDEAKQGQQTIQEVLAAVEPAAAASARTRASQVVTMQRQQQGNLERMILVLRLSGRCPIGSIMEVLQAGLGVKVSKGYVYGILAQARGQAKVALAKLRGAMPFSGAIAIDEVFLREWGKRIYGLVVVDPITRLIMRLERFRDRSHAAIGAILKDLSKDGLNQSVKLVLTDMYAGYEKLVSVYFPAAAHQFCWFHINCFPIGSTVRQAKSGYRQAQRQLETFERQYPYRQTKALKAKSVALTKTLAQAHRFGVGAQRFQSLLENCVQAPRPQQATQQLERLLRVGQNLRNPYINEMVAFLERHRSGLLSFFRGGEQPSLKHLQSLAVVPIWVPLLDLQAIPKTTNAAEHIFRCLRRYLHGMDQVGNEQTTQGFFDLFAFFHNARVLRVGPKAGTSLLAAAGVDVQSIFGSDDPLYHSGVPPNFRDGRVSKGIQKSVKSITRSTGCLASCGEHYLAIEKNQLAT